MVLIIRVVSIHILHIPLYADEAQYWFWSLTPNFGYYSKPPVIAYGIWISTYLFGDSEFAIKLFSPFLHTFIACLIYLIAGRISRSVASTSAFLYITMPAVSISSLIISTDPFLMMFWALSLLFLLRAHEKDAWLDWVMLGAFCGLGMLSKYNMILFLPSALLYSFLNTNKKQSMLNNRKFYVALLVSFLVFSPNIWWNLQHHFVSFKHIKELTGSYNGWFNIKKGMEFLGAQFGIMGPILFSVILYIPFKLFKVRKKVGDEKLLLICFTYPFILVMIGIGFISKAYANWAAPAYISGVILAAIYLHENKKKLIVKSSLAFGVFFGSLVYSYQPIISFLGIYLTSSSDIFYRMRGGREMSIKLAEIMKDYPNAVIAVAERKDQALITYYLRGEGREIIKWNPEKLTKDYFAMVSEANDYKGRDIIIVTDSNGINLNQSLAEEIKALGILCAKVYKDLVIRRNIILLKNFYGY